MLAMGIYPPPLEKLIAEFTKLPGIGQKSATRLAFHIMRSGPELAAELAESLIQVKEKIRFCSVCFNLTDCDPCNLCQDPARANGSICVVESPGDQLALEESGIFSGRYHILHGLLSPLDGVGPKDLKVGELLTRIENQEIREVILATSPTAEGEATSSFIAKVISEKDAGVKLTRIALGVPMGGDLKYMDRMTLQHALRSRTPIER
jgi:recombination protein RecR